MRRVIRYARRNKLLVAATALLMAGAGCLGAVRESADQLSEDALKPITMPIEAYDRSVETASNVEAIRQERLRQGGFEE